MNYKEHALGELELRPLHAKEALQCMLHSILFLRAPNVVRPREVGFGVLGVGEGGERLECWREEREGRISRRALCAPCRPRWLDTTRNLAFA